MSSEFPYRETDFPTSLHDSEKDKRLQGNKVT